MRRRQVSRLHQRFDAVAVEAFTGGKGFGGETAVKGRFNAQHKLAAEITHFAQRFGQGTSIRFEQFNPLLDNLAEFGIDLRFIVTVTALADDRRRAADKAAVFIAPLHQLGVLSGFCFQFALFHCFVLVLVPLFAFNSLFQLVQCPPHFPFLIMLGVAAGISTHRHPQSFRMNKIPMAALAVPVHKPGFFQVGYQLADFSRHFSINLVSQLFKTVKQLVCANCKLLPEFPHCWESARKSGVHFNRKKKTEVFFKGLPIIEEALEGGGSKFKRHKSLSVQFHIFRKCLIIKRKTFLHRFENVRLLGNQPAVKEVVEHV